MQVGDHNPFLTNSTKDDIQTLNHLVKLNKNSKLYVLITRFN